MNIWYLTTEYPPYFGGGIATYSRLTVAGWRMMGHQVTVVVRDPEGVTQDGLVAERPEPGVTVVRFGGRYRPAGTDGLVGVGEVAWQYQAAVLEWIRATEPPDILETQDFNAIAYFLLARRAALDPALPPFPVVVTIHSPKFLLDPYEDTSLYRLPEYWIGHMERFVLAAADHVLFPSQYVWDHLKAHVPNLTGTVLRNPLPLPAPAPPPRDRRIVLAVGRLQLLKGTVDLVEAFAGLWDRGETVQLELMGHDGWYHARGESVYQYLAKRYQPYRADDRFLLGGPARPEQVAARLARAGVVAVPSRFENLPYAVLEPMAQGRIVVASDTGGQRELIRSGENGWLVAGQDPERWRDRLLAVLQQSDAEWDAMGAAARATVAAECDPARVAAAKSEHFSAIVQRFRRGGPRAGRHYPFVHPVGDRAAANPEPATLSVVIPYFNMGDFVEACLTSVYASELPPHEVLVVDDGSTDLRSVAQLYRLEDDPRFPRLRVLRGPNQGLAVARNRGARRATGTYLAFLDPDDLVDPRYWAWAVRLMTHYDNVGVVGAWAQYFGEDDTLWPSWNPELPYLLYHNTMNTSSLVVRRADFLAHGQNDPSFRYGMEDWDALVSLVGAGVGGVALPAPLFWYRVRPDSMSRAFRPESLMFLYQKLAAKHQALFAAHAEAVVGLLNANGPQYLAVNPVEGSAYAPPADWFQPPEDDEGSDEAAEANPPGDPA